MQNPVAATIRTRTIMPLLSYLAVMVLYGGFPPRISSAIGAWYSILFFEIRWLHYQQWQDILWHGSCPVVVRSGCTFHYSLRTYSNGGWNEEQKIVRKECKMSNSLLVLLAVLLLATSTLSGCILAVEDEGYRRGNFPQRDHRDGGDRRGESHGDRR